MDRNKLLNGIGGNVWVDGELLCNVKSVDLSSPETFRILPAAETLPPMPHTKDMPVRAPLRPIR